MFYTADQLSQMTMEELEKAYQQLPTFTQEQKEKAWKQMDIGIYDNNTNLIGDTQMYEDGYDDNVKHKRSQAIVIDIRKYLNQ